MRTRYRKDGQLPRHHIASFAIIICSSLSLVRPCDCAPLDCKSPALRGESRAEPPEFPDWARPAMDGEASREPSWSFAIII